MSTDELVQKLEAQLNALQAPPANFAVRNFNVWDGTGSGRPLESATVRIEKKTWSWGHCRSETCAHCSHDPYRSGDTVFVLCRPVGTNEESCQIFQTPDGLIFRYDSEQHNGYHFAPAANIAIE